ncbi:unnamed protein product [Coffea canephora]|uniref:GDSL esterase/lipase n=1 Tax=Coffea canephora TaxID=49390 RepID=A0A068V7H6_COFCA|nr:unnamed protein product [Coffea canephora]
MKMTKENRIELNLANSCIQLCLIVLLVVLASLTIPSDCFHHDDHHSETTAALFVIGDSLVDPGNKKYINTTTGRFCDGRVIPDFIAEDAKLPFLPPYLRIGYQYQLAFGTNFASGGAGALVETFPGLVIDLQKPLGLCSNGCWQHYRLFEENIQEKWEKIWGVLKLPPIGCLPRFRAADVAAGATGECNGQITAVAELHCVLLSKNLSTCRSSSKALDTHILTFLCINLIALQIKYVLIE